MQDNPSSPFLPDGRQWAWNSTSLDPAKACARKYYYQVVRGLRLKTLSVHLEFGSLYASALELYHRKRAIGWSYNVCVEAVVAYVLESKWDSEDPIKNRQSLIRTIVWYLEHYKNDPCQTVILADGSPAVELTFQFPVTDEISLCGHIDRVVSYGGNIYVQDQKTTKRALSSWYFQGFEMSGQMSLYTLAAEVVWNVPVKGVMIDAAQIQPNGSRFERAYTFRTPDQTWEWLNQTRYHIENIWEARHKYYPMNETACHRFGGACEFLEVCSKSPHVREAYLATRYEERHYSPLEVR